MLKFQLLFPTTRTQTLSKSINHCKQRTSVAGNKARSRITKDENFCSFRRIRQAHSLGSGFSPGADFAAGRGDGESASKFLASFPDEPEHGKQLMSPFLSTILQMPADPPRNWAQESSFPLACWSAGIKSAEFEEISGRRREREGREGKSRL